jgi:hypothetical protein
LLLFLLFWLVTEWFLMNVVVIMLFLLDNWSFQDCIWIFKVIITIINFLAYKYLPMITFNGNCTTYYNMSYIINVTSSKLYPKTTLGLSWGKKLLFENRNLLDFCCPLVESVFFSPFWFCFSCFAVGFRSWIDERHLGSVHI